MITSGEHYRSVYRVAPLWARYGALEENRPAGGFRRAARLQHVVSRGYGQGRTTTGSHYGEQSGTDLVGIRPYHVAKVAKSPRVTVPSPSRSLHVKASMSQPGIAPDMP